MVLNQNTGVLVNGVMTRSGLKLHEQVSAHSLMRDECTTKLLQSAPPPLAAGDVRRHGLIEGPGKMLSLPEQFRRFLRM